MFQIAPHRQSPRIARATSVPLVILALLVAGCSGDHPLTSPTASKSLSVSFAAAPVLPTASGQMGVLPIASGNVLTPLGFAAGSLQTVSGTDTLVISKIQLVLSHVELTQVAGTQCDDDSELAGCTELERHFVLVDLPTDTAVHTAIASSIPPGTYSSLEARLRVPHSTDDSSAAAFVAAHPEFAGANTLVQGTYKGQPFTYLGSVDTRFELSFAPPIVVTVGGVNVTVHVDPTTWFRDSSGGLLDPATANAGGVNASLVSANIRHSFHAVRDDERDGHDHGGEHNGGANGHG
jgi:hypothetical protein